MTIFKKVKKEKYSLQSQMIWNAAGYLVYMFCQWLITFLIANISTDLADAGILSLAMSVSATFQTIATFGIRNYQVSDVAGEYSDTCYVHFRWITCGISLISCAVFAFFSRSSLEQFVAVIFYMIFRLSENFADVLHGIAQKNKRLDVSGKSLALNSIVSLAAFLGGYIATKQILVGLGLMAGLSVVSIVVYDIPAVKKLAKFKMFDKRSSYAKLTGHRSQWISLAWHTLPLAVYLFLNSALSAIPKLLLEKFYNESNGMMFEGVVLDSDTVLGIYSSVFAPALLISAMASYLYSPFVPFFAEAYRAKDTKAFLKTFIKLTVAITALGIIVIIAAVFLGEFGLSILFASKPEIPAHSHLLIPIMVGIFVGAIFTFLCTLEVVFRDFLWLIISCATGALIEIFATIPLIKQFGMDGATYSLIIASAIPAVILLLRMLWILLRKGKRQKGV